MATEDYVSFETAKLLKEKGFDWETHRSYLSNDNVFVPGDVNDLPYRKDAIRIPTLQMAMKWMREKHNLGVFPSWSQVFGCYGCRLYYLEKGRQELYSLGAHYDTYEEACEAGIKYCLENSI